MWHFIHEFPDWVGWLIILVGIGHLCCRSVSYGFVGERTVKFISSRTLKCKPFFSSTSRKYGDVFRRTESLPLIQCSNSIDICMVLFFFFKIHFYVFDVVYYRRYRNKMGKQKSFETNRNACLLIAFRVRVYGCVFRPRRIHGPNRNDKISRTWKNGVKNLKKKIDVWKLRGEHFACRT